MSNKFRGRAPVHESDGFGPDTVLQYIQAFNNMKNTNDANDRAQMQEDRQAAQFEWAKQTKERTEYAATSLDTYSKEGLNLELLLSSDYSKAYSTALPSMLDGYQAYASAMKAKNMPADPTVYSTKRKAEMQAYMRAVANRFNLEARTLQRNNPNASPEKINLYLKKHFNGDMVLENYIKAFGDNSGIEYQHVDDDLPWTTDVKDFFWEPGVEGGEGNVRGKAVGATIATGVSAEMLRRKSKSTFTKASEDYLEEAEKNWRFSKKKGGMDSATYMKTYGEAKSTSGAPSKDAKYNASKNIVKYAKNTGHRATFYGRPAQIASNIGKALSPSNILEQAKKIPGLDKVDTSYIDRLKKEADYLDELVPLGKDKTADIDFKGEKATLNAKIREMEKKFAKKYGFTADKPYNLKRRAVRMGKASLPYAIGGHLGAEAGVKAGEAMFGEKGGVVGGIAGGVGGSLSAGKLVKKLSDPKVLAKLQPVLKKVAPKLAAKMALSATGLVAPELVSSAAGAAGLAWSAYDIYQLAKSVPEIARILAE